MYNFSFEDVESNSNVISSRSAKSKSKLEGKLAYLNFLIINDLRNHFIAVIYNRLSDFRIRCQSY
jgi:hypothetical protein